MWRSPPPGHLATTRPGITTTFFHGLLCPRLDANLWGPPGPLGWHLAGRESFSRHYWVPAGGRHYKVPTSSQNMCSDLFWPATTRRGITTTFFRGLWRPLPEPGLTPWCVKASFRKTTTTSGPCWASRPGPGAMRQLFAPFLGACGRQTLQKYQRLPTTHVAVPSGQPPHSPE